MANGPVWGLCSLGLMENQPQFDIDIDKLVLWCGVIFCDAFQVEAKNKKLQELNRFVHYYSRFKNHENSYKVLLIYVLSSVLSIVCFMPRASFVKPGELVLETLGFISTIDILWMPMWHFIPRVILDTAVQPSVRILKANLKYAIISYEYCILHVCKLWHLFAQVAVLLASVEYFHMCALGYKMTKPWQLLVFCTFGFCMILHCVFLPVLLIVVITFNHLQNDLNRLGKEGIVKPWLLTNSCLL